MPNPGELTRFLFLMEARQKSASQTPLTAQKKPRKKRDRRKPFTTYDRAFERALQNSVTLEDGCIDIRVTSDRMTRRGHYNNYYHGLNSLRRMFRRRPEMFDEINPHTFRMREVFES